MSFFTTIFLSLTFWCFLCLSSNEYSQSGRVLSLEYAKIAASKGDPILGLCCKDGVILCGTCFQGDSPFAEVDSFHDKIWRIDKNIYVLASGLRFDANALQRFRNIAFEHRHDSGFEIPVSLFCEKIGKLFNHQSRMDPYRPIGLSCIVGSVDPASGGQIFSIEPDGDVKSWRMIGFGGTKISDVREAMKKFSSSYDQYNEPSLDDAMVFLRNRLLPILSASNNTESFQSNNMTAATNTSRSGWKNNMISRARVSSPR